MSKKVRFFPRRNIDLRVLAEIPIKGGCARSCRTDNEKVRQRPHFSLVSFLNSWRSSRTKAFRTQSVRAAAGGHVPASHGTQSVVRDQ